MGCVTQVGEQALNVGRQAVLVGGWPETVAASTIDRQCGSSLQAAFNGASAIGAGHLDLVVAAGVEHMTRVPMGSNLGDAGWGAVNEKIGERWPIVPQGISAEVHRGGVGPDARAARRVLARVAPACGRRDRRGPLRERDRPDRGRRRRRGGAVRGRRDAAARHVAREARVAPARVQAGRRDHGRELELDRRRLGRDAARERRPPSSASASSRARAGSRSGSPASTRIACCTATRRRARARSRRRG